MASIVIKHLDPLISARLSNDAVEHGRSIEEEVCAVLREKYQTDQPTPAESDTSHPYDRIRALVEKYGGADDLVIPPREVDPDRDIFES